MGKANTNKIPLGSFLKMSLLCILSLLAWVVFFAVAWYCRIYGDTGFDSVIFTLISSMEGTDSGLIFSYLLEGLLPAVICALGQWLGLYLLRRPSRLVIRLLSLVLSLALLTVSTLQIGLIQFFYARMQQSTLYETEYVDPNTVDIQFPERKRNLIYIYLESMETTFLDQSLGGAIEVNLIPELTELAQNHVNFSHNDSVGGLVELPGLTWSMAAMIAQTAGVPMVLPRHTKHWHKASGSEAAFLPGLTALGDILAQNGYYQTLMMGCDSNYGGESAYAMTHRMDKIYDLYTGRQDGIVPEDYFAWWGFEDKHLFAYAKQELMKISQGDQPFAFTLLTMDTHHIDGYNCSLCSSDRAEPYENVFSCASRQVAAFVQWIQAQPFYENTTIVITGDHFSMDAQYFSRNVEKSYARHGYNCILNAPIQASNTKNRIFSSLDMFPTTLAALGCQIQGDRLGLGVNLFSELDTLPEAYGLDAFCAELSKSTAYFDQFLEP